MPRRVRRRWWFRYPKDPRPWRRLLALAPVGAFVGVGYAADWTPLGALVPPFLGFVALTQGILLGTHRCATPLSNRYAMAIGVIAIGMSMLAATPWIGMSPVTPGSMTIYVCEAILCVWLLVLGHEALHETPFGVVDPDVFS